jgi:hypothetical protein
MITRQKYNLLNEQDFSRYAPRLPDMKIEWLTRPLDLRPAL